MKRQLISYQEGIQLLCGRICILLVTNTDLHFFSLQETRHALPTDKKLQLRHDVQAR